MQAVNHVQMSSFFFSNNRKRKGEQLIIRVGPTTINAVLYIYLKGECRLC